MAWLPCGCPPLLSLLLWEPFAAPGYLCVSHFRLVDADPWGRPDLHHHPNLHHHHYHQAFIPVRDMPLRPLSLLCSCDCECHVCRRLPLFTSVALCAPSSRSWWACSLLFHLPPSHSICISSSLSLKLDFRRMSSHITPVVSSVPVYSAFRAKELHPHLLVHPLLVYPQSRLVPASLFTIPDVAYEVLFPHLSDGVPLYFPLLIRSPVPPAPFVPLQVIHAIAYDFFPLSSICCQTLRLRSINASLS